MVLCGVIGKQVPTTPRQVNNGYMASAVVRHQAALLASWAFPAGAGYSAAARS